MGKACCAVDCTNRFNKKSESSFYRLPNDKVKRSKWIAAIRRNNWNTGTETWICGFHFVSAIQLEHRVLVALAGEDVHVDFKVVQPINQSGGMLACFKHKGKKIYSSNLPATAAHVVTLDHSVKLKRLASTDSGEYHCQYKSVLAFWVLLVRDEGYWEPFSISGYRGILIVGVLTFVLLNFSVVGSVYVFKGHWDNVTESSVSEGPRGQERREEEEEADNKDMMAAASTSFYASLEPRPRSIYDVLDHSAPNIETGQRKANWKSKESEKPMKQIPHNQDDGVFESVYENF